MLYTGSVSAPAPDNLPPKKPPRHPAKVRSVARHHAYYVATHGGECPTLKELANAVGVPKSTAYRACLVESLALSQSRPRRPRTEGA